MVKKGLVGQRHSQLGQLEILTAEILSEEISRNLMTSLSPRPMLPNKLSAMGYASATSRLPHRLNE
jgi:hypothetical protein